MRGREALVGCMVGALAGCSTVTPRHASHPTEASRACERALSAPTCAGPDPRSEALAVRIALRNGRVGFNTRAELAGTARDRDELVGRLVARHRRLGQCLPPGPARDAILADSTRLMKDLLIGLSPGDCDTLVEVVDRRRPPHALPLFTRVCEHPQGLEGEMQCIFFLSVPLVLADLVTLPLGSWFWAAPDRDETLVLGDTFPPPPALVAAVKEVSQVTPSTSASSTAGPSPPSSP